MHVPWLLIRWRRNELGGTTAMILTLLSRNIPSSAPQRLMCQLGILCNLKILRKLLTLNSNINQNMFSKQKTKNCVSDPAMAIKFGTYTSENQFNQHFIARKMLGYKYI